MDGIKIKESIETPVTEITMTEEDADLLENVSDQLIKAVRCIVDDEAFNSIIEGLPVKMAQQIHQFLLSQDMSFQERFVVVCTLAGGYLDMIHRSFRLQTQSDQLKH